MLTKDQWLALGEAACDQWAQPLTDKLRGMSQEERRQLVGAFADMTPEQIRDLPDDRVASLRDLALLQLCACIRSAVRHDSPQEMPYDW